MSEDSSNESPKSLADVSHLFFSGGSSGAGPQAEKPSTEADVPASEPTGSSNATRPADTGAAESDRDDRRPTRVFVVTGGDGRPGKSTVAVNVAEALTAHGRTVLCDTDPRIPNARFYLGLPSWNYLSPLTGGGEPAPNVLADAGLLVVDGTAGLMEKCAGGSVRHLLSVELPCGETCDVDFVVIDSPIRRAALSAEEIGQPASFMVVAAPREEGFLEAYGALATLARDVGVGKAALVVNGAPSTSYARAFHAKMRAAAERLLSMELPLLGAVVREPGLGALQRERGVMVRSRPDATSALLLREIASNALALEGALVRSAGGSVEPA